MLQFHYQLKVLVDCSKVFQALLSLIYNKMKKCLKVKKLLSAIVMGLILIPYSTLLLPNTAEALTWTNVGNKVVKATVDGATGDDVAVIFSGYRVPISGAKAWATALIDVDRGLKSKGVKTVYAVAGPYETDYSEKNTANKIATSEIISEIKSGWQARRTNSRIIVIDHSSGAWVAMEFLKGLDTYIRVVTVFNVDGDNSTALTSSGGEFVSKNYDVYGINQSGTVSSTYADQALTPKEALTIDTTGCPTTNLKACLHMRLVNRTSTQGFGAVNADYNGITTANVEMRYLERIQAIPPPSPPTGKCEIESATIVGGGSKKQKDGWYVKGASKIVIKVESQYCAQKEIGFKMFEHDSADPDDLLVIKGLPIKDKIKAPSDRFFINIIAGVEYCDKNSDPDCQIYFDMGDESRMGFTTSQDQPSGQIGYDCSNNIVNCDTDPFIYAGVEENKLPKGQLPVITPAVDTSDPYNSDYNLLAPIGDLKKIDANKTIGDYLNILFKLAIGLCIALSVIMLVVYGIQYMGNESVFGHTEAKSRIMTILLGLILALSAYAILNTINPDLVSGELNVQSITLDMMTDNLENVVPPQTGTSQAVIATLWPHGQVCKDFANSSTPMSVFTAKVVKDGGLLTQDIHECNGVDIGTYAKDPVPIYAMADGVVLASESGCKEGTKKEDKECGGKFGNYIMIQHAGGVRSMYAHGVNVRVKKNDNVKSGQHIMDMGNTGFSTHRHLHLNIYNAKNPYSGKGNYKPI
jgi:hypothetical protein